MFSWYTLVWGMFSWCTLVWGMFSWCTLVWGMFPWCTLVWGMFSFCTLQYRRYASELEVLVHVPPPPEKPLPAGSASAFSQCCVSALPGLTSPTSCPVVYAVRVGCRYPSMHLEACILGFVVSSSSICAARSSVSGAQEKGAVGYREGCRGEETTFTSISFTATVRVSHTERSMAASSAITATARMSHTKSSMATASAITATAGVQCTAARTAFAGGSSLGAVSISAARISPAGGASLSVVSMSAASVAPSSISAACPRLWGF
ncbi:UNVERIFIED_CONTAM: hypothetical protein FKN15_023387 [Acipenser sinensis]